MTKRIVVTGASSGIGRAIAARLLDDGHVVVGLSRTEPDLNHDRFHHERADLADLDSIGPLARQLGAVDGFVHSAGFMKTARLGELDAASGEAMWRIHVGAASALADALVPAMRDGGRIVLIGSRTSGGAAGRSQYAAAKAAVVGMARSWAIELAPRGITVNVVSPAATETPMLKDPARTSSAPVMPPIGRYIRTEEVAALVAFLIGPDAGAITGQQIMVCGGSSLAHA
ncbi:SDR family NAD(P)-dependent oxidoreductase [Burkholderia sp. Bp8963]|uniref:SDR family NAD(P)-dependent oxidoreductase n=1 Tax=Burkholderia sp. Bp8963 TaxID=2184547 RepID=UPI000F590810|nr:SDR family oxidoreductase [Burkholderia sp. Bp8963]RQS66499.1 SDR family NAD(P)-dependent oxidoreductase [Burkholderia sp. Bp8963]